MSDLSNLFLGQPQPTTKFAKHSRACSNWASSGHKSQEPFLWNIKELESTLKNNIKEKMNEQSLSHQLQKFESQQKKEFLEIGVFFGVSLSLVCCSFELDMRVSFHLLLLFLTCFLPQIAFRLTQESIVSTTLWAIKPIIYAATFYYLLKVCAGVSIEILHLPFTMAALWATFLKMSLEYFEVVYVLQIEHLSSIIIREKSFLKRLSLLPFFLWERVKYFWEVGYIVLLSSTVIAVLALVASWTFNLEVKGCLQPLNIIYLISTFFFLEIYMELVRLLSNLFGEELSGSRDKLPIILNLLRLDSKGSFSARVHKKCLQSLYLKMQKVPCFLSNETCKSLIFSKYMDILTSYSSRQLQQLLQATNRNISQVELHSRVFRESKTLKQDLFMPFRKLASLLSQLHALRQTLALLVSKKDLFKVIWLADEQAFLDKDEVRVDQRILEVLQILVSKISMLQRTSMQKGVLASNLQAYQRELRGKVFSMRKGWV